MTPASQPRWLLRVLSSIDFYSVEEDKIIVVKAAFLPNNGDGNGLSLYREYSEEFGENFPTAELLINSRPNPAVKAKGGVYAVAQEYCETCNIKIKDEGSDAVDYQKDGQIANSTIEGHVLFVNMSRSDYDSSTEKKQQIKKIADSLARAVERLGPLLRIRPTF